jgi:hypothetical protein
MSRVIAFEQAAVSQVLSSYVENHPARSWQSNCPLPLQAFINTAGSIYKKIEDGVFDVSNEVSLVQIYNLVPCPNVLWWRQFSWLVRLRPVKVLTYSLNCVIHGS